MSSRSRGRPPKYPVEEVRRRLIEVGIRTLQTCGVSSGLRGVTLDGSIAEAEVPRGSAYRLWHSDVSTPQDEFRRAVVLELMRTFPAQANGDLVDTMYSRVADFHLDAEVTDPQANQDALRELIRQYANENQERLTNSEDWGVYFALRSAALTQTEDHELRDAVAHGERLLIDRYVQLFEHIAERFGMTLREPFTAEDFASAAYGLAEGLSLQPAATGRRAALTSTDGDREWSMLAVGIHGLVDRFWEAT